MRYQGNYKRENCSGVGTGHVERFVRRKVSRIEVPGNIMGKGGPKKTWKNRVIKDMREKELTEVAQNQDLWRED